MSSIKNTTVEETSGNNPEAHWINPDRHAPLVQHHPHVSSSHEESNVTATTATSGLGKDDLDTGVKPIDATPPTGHIVHKDNDPLGASISQSKEEVIV